jgi:hypothetical protein
MEGGKAKTTGEWVETVPIKEKDCTVFHAVFSCQNLDHFFAALIPSPEAVLLLKEP